MPSEEVKPYPDDVWWLKRLGISFGVLVAAGAISGIAAALGAPNAVIGGFFVAALVGVVAYDVWLFRAMWRREQRRQALRVQRRGELSSGVARTEPSVGRAVSLSQLTRGERVALALWMVLVPVLLIAGILMTALGSGATRGAGIALLLIGLVATALSPLFTARVRRRHSTPAE